jgi:hypothetical protein
LTVDLSDRREPPQTTGASRESDGRKVDAIESAALRGEWCGSVADLFTGAVNRFLPCV